MAKQIKLKTSKREGGVSAYIKNLSKEQQKEAAQLKKLFTETTRCKAKMWGTSIVGFGEYVYHRSNGDEGTIMATGFSMRKSGPTLYIMPGYQDYSDLMTKLGPHKLGKSCLYLKNLDTIDLTVVKKLIKTGIKDLKKTHQVTMK
tara:strand:+ start:5463 stop:5897 length:435 start_codon:yes stop_codon:yes gene_type:complete